MLNLAVEVDFSNIENDLDYQQHKQQSATTRNRESERIKINDFQPVGVEGDGDDFMELDQFKKYNDILLE